MGSRRRPGCAPVDEEDEVPPLPDLCVTFSIRFEHPRKTVPATTVSSGGLTTWCPEPSGTRRSYRDASRALRPRLLPTPGPQRIITELDRSLAEVLEDPSLSASAR